MKESIWEMVDEIASKSNCEKRHVACVITDDNGVMVATGFNTHVDGVCDCSTTKTAVHAEVMAINSIPIYSRSDDLYAYINHAPCERCGQLLNTVCNEVHVQESSEIKDDKVNPKHYADVDNVPTIRFFESAARSTEGYQDYLHLTAMKYVYRVWNKDDPKTNIGKCKWFLNKLEESIDGRSD